MSDCWKTECGDVSGLTDDPVTLPRALKKKKKRSGASVCGGGNQSTAMRLLGFFFVFPVAELPEKKINIAIFFFF